MARHLDALAAGLAGLAEAEGLPYPPSIPDNRKGEVAAMWNDLFGGWKQGLESGPSSASSQ
jgi:hypothetical protein